MEVDLADKHGPRLSRTSRKYSEIEHFVIQTTIGEAFGKGSQPSTTTTLNR